MKFGPWVRHPGLELLAMGLCYQDSPECVWVWNLSVGIGQWVRGKVTLRAQKNRFKSMQMLVGLWQVNCHSLSGSACVFHPAGITAYQSYPWGNMCSQPAMHQHSQCVPAYPGSLGPGQDHQTTSSTSFPPPSFFPGGDHDSSHANSHHPSFSQIHTSTTTSTTTVLPPVSSLRPSCLRVEATPTKESSLLPSQVNAASPESPPVPPCVKIEYDSPREIHSHFHCDFSPIHFWLCVCVCFNCLY